MKYELRDVPIHAELQIIYPYSETDRKRESNADQEKYL